MRREYDKTAITFTLTKAGRQESEPVSLTGKELAELPKMIAGKKMGPRSKAQTEASALFEEFVRRGLGR